MRHDSDSAVIGESLATPSAFGEIFDRYDAEIFRYLRRRAGEDAAADLTAEVFAQAFRDRARFDGERGSALPWLFGIASNLLRMRFRSERRRLAAFARVRAPADAGEQADGIHDRLEALAARDALAEALRSLSAQQRDVLLLHAWAELTPAEIAVALELRPGTVRSELHRARTLAASRLALTAPYLMLTVEDGR